MTEKIRSLFPRYPSKRAVTLPALHMVQEHLRCVPYQAMAEIAELLEITPAEVHDTMSFYGFFPQAPIGDVRVWICRSCRACSAAGTSCWSTRATAWRSSRARRPPTAS